jgi:hypothetical protein
MNYIDVAPQTSFSDASPLGGQGIARQYPSRGLWASCFLKKHGQDGFPTRLLLADHDR